MRSPAAIAAPLLLALGALPGCEGTTERLRSFCTSDADCPPGRRCDRSSGRCLCASDGVCAADEYCAPDGACRKRMSCDTNLDCPADTFCDTTTGNCIEQDRCTRDAQCPAGTICSAVSFECKSGCQVAGDCTLGQVCRAGACQDGLCDDLSYCDYGALCDPDTQTCFADTRGPYCGVCASGTIADPYRCGEGPNFCVMTNNDPRLAPFCGVDCDAGQVCPNGYDCDLILISPEGACRADADCQSGQCYKNEGDEVGFCLCSRDDQCPEDSCDDTLMLCRITRRGCTPDGGECGRPIYCIDGLCLIGRNCVPKEGLDCADFGK